MDKKIKTRVSARAMRVIVVACAVLISATGSSLFGLTPTNFDRLYDRAFHRQGWHGGHVRINGTCEYGYKTAAFNADEQKCDPTQIYTSNAQPRESALAMLEGYGAYNNYNRLANRVRGFQDGVRGTLETTGKLHGCVSNMSAQWHLSFLSLPGEWTLHLGTSLSSFGLTDVQWTDKTDKITLQDKMVRDTLTKNIAQFAQKNSLTLGEESAGWKLGDSLVQLEWSHTFIQRRNRLKSVQVELRAGSVIPTGAVRDEDRAFDLGNGHDGTWGVPLGGGLLLDLDGGVKVGLDIGMLLLASKTKLWRLKTHRAQTEHLLLTKGRATKEYGPEWKFNLFTQFYSLLPGLTVTCGYQLYKHDEDSFYPQDYNLSAAIIDSSQSKEESASHNIILNCAYGIPGRIKSPVRPEIFLQAKIPFGGLRTMSMHTLSAGFSVSF